MDTKKILVACSILSSDFSRLRDEVTRMEEAGADMVHVDVMDGHFVPNITIGQPVVKALRKATRLPLDVHLMIKDPEKFAGEFIDAGADILTIHVEASKTIKQTLALIKKRNVRAGLSINPPTALEHVMPYLDLTDMILVMTVNPGFGGQAFIEEVVPKIAQLRAVYPRDIEVDGGINTDTAREVCRAGANILVTGSYLFSAKDPAATIRALKTPKPLVL
jgi:ribulose-phosphate 3-epimerase